MMSGLKSHQVSRSYRRLKTPKENRILEIKRGVEIAEKIGAAAPS